MAERCAGRKFKDWRYVQCQNPGKLEHDGKMWCGTHHPPSAKARRAARNAAYDERLRQEAFERLAAAEMRRRQTIDGMTDDELLAECKRRGWQVSR